LLTLAAVVAVAIIVGIGLGFAVVGVTRALPGRYAYYLPESLQKLRERPHPDTLPAPTTLSIPTVATASAATDMPTWQPDPTPTVIPTAPPTAAPSATVPPTPAPTPAPPSRAVLTGIRHEHQGWNNCGPTTFGMALSYFGMDLTQADLAPVMKPDPEDKHVDVEDMEAYAREAGLGFVVRVNGSVERVKELLRAGYPVIVASWHVRDARDQLGHYRLISGYDDSLGEFVLQDSLDGPDLPISYRELDELWRVYNRTYVLTYPSEKSGEVAALLGEDTDDAGMYERAAMRAQQEAANPPADCVAYASCDDWVTFSWFNLGSSLTALGRHEEAAAAYDQARQLGLPFRMLWYQFGPYESYYAVGRHDDVIALADATLNVADNLEESHYWRGVSRLALGDVDGARKDFQAALRYHAGWPPAVAALAGLD
jgi:hypothetical protein